MNAWENLQQCLSLFQEPLKIKWWPLRLSLTASIAEGYHLRANGGYSNGDPPLTIPNREVKPIHADGTAARWESRSLPIFTTKGLLM